MPAHDIVIAFGAGAGDAQTQLPAHIAAAWAAVAVTSSSGGTPDPTQLPVANNQAFDTTHLYGLDIAAGQSFTDPTTGAKVFRVSAPDTPQFSGSDNENCQNQYGSRGPFLSRVWASGGKNYFTLGFSADSPFGGESTDLYMVDYCLEDEALSNYRSYRNVGELWGGQSYNSWAFMLDNSAYYRYIVGDDGGTIRCWDTADHPPTEITSFNALPYSSGLGRCESFCTGIHSFITFEKYTKEDVVRIDRDTVGGDPCTYAETETPDPGGVQAMRDTALFGIEYDDIGNPKWKRITAACSFGTASPKFQSHGDMGYGYGISLDPSGAAPRVWWWDPTITDGIEGSEWGWLGDTGDLIGGSQHMSFAWCADAATGLAMGKDRSKLWAVTSGWGSSSADMENSIMFIPLDYPTRSTRLLCHHGTDPVDDSQFYAQPHGSVQPEGYGVVYETNHWQHAKWNISNVSGTFTLRETLSCSPSGATLTYLHHSGGLGYFIIASGTPTGSDTATGASGSFDLDTEVYGAGGRIDVFLAITPTS